MAIYTGDSGQVRKQATKISTHLTKTERSEVDSWDDERDQAEDRKGGFGDSNSNVGLCMR